MEETASSPTSAPLDLQEKLFLTSCEVCRLIRNPSSVEKINEALSDSGSKIASKQKFSKTEQLTARFLDKLAFLLVAKPGSDVVAVALAGISNDKIDLIASQCYKPNSSRY